MNDQGRILNIFLRLFFGEKLQKKSLADEFEVNERTIQRDLSFLRYFVSVHSSILGNLVYNRDIKKYSIDRPSTIEKQEVLFISKILLENRALNKNEFNRVINSLLNTLSIDDKKLIESVIASEKLNDRYLFLSEDTPGYKKAFSVIRDTSTKIVMNYSNIEQEESLWIDIFPIDGLPEKGVKRKLHEKQYLFRRMMVQLSQFNSIVNQNKTNRPWYEKVIIKIAGILKIENLLSFEKAQQKYLATIKKYNITEGYAGNFTGAYKLRELVPSCYFGEPVKLDFEGIKLNCPNKYKDYLKAIYGDNYMTLPPIEQRLPHQYEIVSLGE